MRLSLPGTGLLLIGVAAVVTACHVDAREGATDDSNLTSDASAAAPAPAAQADAGRAADAGPKVDDDGPFDPQTAAEIGDLFKRVMDSRHPPGATNVKRAVFLKPHGCAQATFEIPSDLPNELRVGLFATPGVHDAWLRFSSDTVPTTSDHQNNTIGFAVKVLGVPGRKILAGEEDFATHDFLLQNHPVFFTDTAKDFLDFTKAIFARTDAQYLAAHPRTKTILDEMAKETTNVLQTAFWSTTPYRFGDTYAKYRVIPCAAGPIEPPPADEDNYLRKRLERDMQSSGACLQFQVQLRTPEMPLDAQTVPWSDAVSPPVTVATIHAAPQNILAHDASCEDFAFTAWHALPEHQPVGSVNKARGLIYKRLSDVRRGRNNVPIREPH